MPRPGRGKQEGARLSSWYLLLVLDNYLSAYFSLNLLRIPGLSLVCAQLCAHGSKDCSKMLPSLSPLGTMPTSTHQLHFALP